MQGTTIPNSGSGWETIEFKPGVPGGLPATGVKPLDNGGAVRWDMTPGAGRCRGRWSGRRWQR